MRVVNGWVDTALEIDYGNKSMDRNGWKPLIIVLHGTAGGSSAQDIAVYFRDGAEQASAHFVIGQDGTVVQGISCDVAAWGNGLTTAGHAPFLPDSSQVNGNWYTISIEHCKPHDDNSDQLTDAQKNTSFALCDALCSAYGIPRKVATDMNGGILGHHDFDPVNRRLCPGPYPTDELISYLNGNSNNTQGDDMLTLSDPWAAGYFSDNGNGQWRCKNGGHIVGGNILKYYCVTQGAARLPLSEEIKDIPGHPEVAYQLFESGIIVFDPNHVLDGPAMPSSYGCYFVKLGTALAQKLLSQPLLNQIASLNAQIASLQQQLQSTQNANVQQLQQQIQTLTTQLSSAKSALAQIATEATNAGK